jgi:hypothetical protein
MIAAEISRALGGHRVGRQWMARCPAHAGGGERTGSLSLRDGYAGVIVHCFAGCDFIDIRDALVDRGLWPARPDRDDEEARRRRQERARRAEAAHVEDEARDRAKAASDLLRAKQILRESVAPTPDTAVGIYLISREILPPWPACIRQHPHLFHRDESGCVSHHPAMVCPIRDIATNAVIGVHRTYLTPDGGKAAVDEPKKVLGRLLGGAVKLSPDANVTLGLGVSEGIETGLSILATGWSPIWSLGTAGNLGKLPVLPGIGALTVFADNDDLSSGTGERAACECATRWRAAGREVRVYIPRAPGNDWQDELGVR